jgi:prophage antirepressor-like protein
LSNLTLVKSESFGNVQCDFYKDSKDVWMTRRQIGDSLEYEDGNQAVKNIHLRHKDRLDKFSRVVQIETPFGKQSTTVYSMKGVYEICRWSQQAKADAFYDWVYETLESLRNGESKIVNIAEYRRMELEAKHNNSLARRANALLKIESRYSDLLSPQSRQLIVGEAVTVLTGKELIGKPQIPITYTATEIGNIAGVSANMIGRLSETHKIKTDEYGIWVLDKSKHSSKQIRNFLYNEAGKNKILSLVGKRNNQLAGGLQ